MPQVGRLVYPAFPQVALGRLVSQTGEDLVGKLLLAVRQGGSEFRHDLGQLVRVLLKSGCDAERSPMLALVLHRIGTFDDIPGPRLA